MQSWRVYMNIITHMTNISKSGRFEAMQSAELHGAQKKLVCILIQASFCICKTFIQCKVIATGIPWVGVSWSNVCRTFITLFCGTNGKGSPSDSACNVVVFWWQGPVHGHLQFVYLYSPLIYIFNHDFIALGDNCSERHKLLLGHHWLQSKRCDLANSVIHSLEYADLSVLCMGDWKTVLNESSLIKILIENVMNKLQKINLVQI